MQEPTSTPPFKSLGNRLKYIREHSSESLAEVSGAVEINEDTLDLIEQGVERPSEEILMLLISHFDMQDLDAVQLWELAGYDRRNTPENVSFNVHDHDDPQTAKSMVMMLAYDTRTQYSDGVDIHVNKAGIVFTFTQAAGQQQQQVVARVGMSLEQAEAVSGVLQQALIRARYGHTKALPSPRTSTTRKRATKTDKTTKQEPKRSNKRGKSNSSDTAQK